MDDGLTLEQHLESYWKQSGVKPEQLDFPPIPVEVQHTWDWWIALNRTRAVGMDANHITYTEIANWSTLLKIGVTDFEVQCIMALDSAYIHTRQKQQAAKQAASGKK
jgi:hypothetical protein